jgi:hypothetical protein
MHLSLSIYCSIFQMIGARRQTDLDKEVNTFTGKYLKEIWFTAPQRARLFQEEPLSRNYFRKFSSSFFASNRYF